MHPRHPRLVIAMRCLLYEIWGLGRKTTKLKKLRLCSNQNLSALEYALRTGAMAMLCTTKTQIEEIWKKEKPEAQAEAKGNIEKQHPKVNNNATMPLYDREL